MKIDLPDEFLERVKKHNKEHEGYATAEAFIESAVNSTMEAYPWFTGDICVHNENCMHCKSVEAWRRENADNTF